MEAEAGLLEPETYSQVNYEEADRVAAEFRQR
jgi:hypothetical protein